MSYLKIRLQPFTVTKAEFRGDDTENQVYLGKPSDFTKLGTAVLVDLFNAFDGGADKKPLKRFADRETAERRTWAVVRPTLESLTNTTLPEELPPMAATATAEKTSAKKSTAKKNGTATTNRARGFDPEANITKLVEEDGRREGTPGAKSFKLIKDGMTVAEFVKKGGRLRDLRWDVAKKHVKIG